MVTKTELLARLRRDQLYLIVGANGLLIVSLLMSQWGLAGSASRIPGGVGIVLGLLWWHRVGVGDLFRSDPDRIRERIVDD